MSKNHGCPECGSTAKKHTDEDCDLAQAAADECDGVRGKTCALGLHVLLGREIVHVR